MDIPDGEKGFFTRTLRDFGMARSIIVCFLAFLLIQAFFLGLPMDQLLSSMLTRFGMNGILALAMIPTIQAGMGPNFALPLGIVCGLLGGTMAIEAGLRGWPSFLLALSLAVLLGGVAGWLYALLLNRIKGQEMTVGTYCGFSVVSLMCIFWTLAPYSEPEMIWAYGGTGLRNTISLAGWYEKILDNLWRVEVHGVVIPTGTLLCFLLACILMKAFLRSKTGIAMTAVGSNPRFAHAIGLRIDRYRTVASILSNALAAAGMLVYAQSFGFLQLYQAPLFMAFFAVASVLIGGASMNRITVANVLIGNFLFQSVLVVSMPVANLVFSDNMSEILRIVISNGIILYALTRKEARA
ncbi:MAG: ABC transporter permease [Synergistaceae bacterium]|jgi:simple sugar transport system permease protein|nr:ABC transporter permease [Synergistaceae bacterium]